MKFASWWLRWYRICLQWGRPGLDPWVGKIPWRRTLQPTPVFLPGESPRQRSLAVHSALGCKESETSEQLSAESDNERIIMFSLVNKYYSIKQIFKYLYNIFNDFIEVEFFIDRSSMCLEKWIFQVQCWAVLSMENFCFPWKHTVKFTQQNIK